MPTLAVAFPPAVIPNIVPAVVRNARNPASKEFIVDPDLPSL